ncbi:TPA: pentapeptide repeat-containing protein [Legionella pneumophila]
MTQRKTFFFDNYKGIIFPRYAFGKKMNKEGFEFDLETRRFLVNRWETDLGQKVQKEIVEGIQRSVEIRAILDDYVLNHKDNIDPYGHPIYPKDAMHENAFWVLTQDDLRGIRIYNTDLNSTVSLEKKSLSYSSFYNCNFTKANLEMSDMSFARFEKCNFENAILAFSGGYNVVMKECNLKAASLYGSFFIDGEFYDSDFSGAEFESINLKNIKINYRTKFNLKLTNDHSERKIPPDQKPDILRAIRIAYENIEAWPERDVFLFEEKTTQRKHLLWLDFKKSKNMKAFLNWGGSLLSSWISGYSTKPLRVIWLSLVTILLYSFIYLSISPKYVCPDVAYCISGSLHYSFLAFTGIADSTIPKIPLSFFWEIASLSEHWVGIIMISLFVVVLARKIIR